MLTRSIRNTNIKQNIRLYYKIQKRNLLFPNEKYINAKGNKNKADYHRFKYVFDIHKNLDGKMLDIGCNDGYFMRTFPWKFSSFSGIDMFSVQKYTNNLFTKNKTKYTLSNKIKYITGLFENIKFSEKFDFVFAGEIIEHVQDPDRFLNCLTKVLSPHSRWCITTPDNVGIDLEEHNRQFSEESLNILLEKYFQTYHIDHLKSPAGSWPFLVAFGSGKRISFVKRFISWTSKLRKNFLRQYSVVK